MGQKQHYTINIENNRTKNAHNSNRTLLNHIPLWNRNRQFLKCMYLPVTKKRKYCEGEIALYELWSSAAVVRTRTTVQLPFPSWKVS